VSTPNFSADDDIERILQEIDTSNSKIIESMSEAEIVSARDEILSTFSTLKVVNKSPNIARKYISEVNPLLGQEERFDLNGRRIFKNRKSLTEEKLVKSMHSLLLARYKSSIELRDPEFVVSLQSIANDVYDTLITTNLVLICEDEPKDQPELYQHEFDPDSPGYTMHELSEVLLYLLCSKS
jgi:hypothetical protein